MHGIIEPAIGAYGDWYLESASATVRTWPKWKQRIIGIVLPEERKAIREGKDVS
jgi:hypothetical protein